nr:CDP-alcohol phosphatidyltransferase family protein [Chryseobacterium sp. CCH4-E10]
MKDLRDKLQLLIYKVINPIVRLFIKLGLTPNMVTFIGLLLNILVATILIFGAEKSNRGDLSYIGWAGALILFAGLFDMLDGQVARLSNKSSKFGALFDSVLDRYSEMILFFGICYYLVAHHYFLSSVFAFLALIGSMMVSYTRSRAEGLGVECKGGLMQRPERIVLISISAIACGITYYYIGSDFKLYFPDTKFQMFETMSIFTFPIAVMAVLTNITAIGRLIEAKKALEKEDKNKKSKNKIGMLLILLMLTGMSGSPQIMAQTSGKYDEADQFPVPPSNNTMMFYLQRTPNTNTIVYALNYDKNNNLPENNPINVYWIRYTEPGSPKKNLNYIQKNLRME